MHVRNIYTNNAGVCIAKSYHDLVLGIPFHYNRIFVLEGRESSQAIVLLLWGIKTVQHRHAIIEDVIRISSGRDGLWFRSWTEVSRCSHTSLMSSHVPLYRSFLSPRPTNRTNRKRPDNRGRRVCASFLASLLCSRPESLVRLDQARDLALAKLQ